MFSENIETKVKRIIKEVRSKGDSAILSFTKKFDNVSLTSGDLKITNQKIMQAYKKVDKDFLDSIKISRENIIDFYKKNLRKSWQVKNKGVILGEILQPIESVGIYIPGGKFPYPSTILMTAVLAKLAGVCRIVMVTPGCNLNPEVLVTADVVGVDEIYQVGGVQAIAALAYGTETIPKVDKIIGPGNIYVTCAKKIVFGDVGIDLIAGPSEIVVLADSTADSTYVVYDLLAQVEHGMQANATLVTTSRDLLKEVRKRLNRNIRNITLIKANTIEEATEDVNKIAPEHLEILVKNPTKVLSKIKNAGAIFVGEFSPVAVGDYIAGPSHVLPTGGSARFSSGLGVDDFLKRSSLIWYNKKALEKYSKAIEKLAEVEGLKMHAKTIRIRFLKGGKGQ